MDNRTAAVDRYLATLNHPHRDAVQRLRLAILASNPAVTEQVKWKAPSFCFDGVDRVTFKLHPHDSLDMIFHRGAAVRPDSDRFTFDDPTGLLRWITTDRAVLTLTDMTDAVEKQPAIIDLVTRWGAAE